jgi:hypothetical protein
MDRRILTVAVAVPLLLVASVTDASLSSSWSSQGVDPSPTNETDLIRALISHVSPNGDSGADPTYVSSRSFSSVLVEFSCLFRSILLNFL